MKELPRASVTSATLPRYPSPDPKRTPQLFIRTEPHNPGIAIRIPGGSCGYLCHIVADVPGVTLRKQSSWFWPIFNRDAEFSFRGYDFVIEPDYFDGVYWILSKDGLRHEEEMHELQIVVERFMSPGRRILELFRRIIPWGAQC
jgi:hypothetical protein